MSAWEGGVASVILMGVSGSGKSTLGEYMAEHFGFVFLDADDFHPPENVAKMRAGLPLDDEDRAPWLSRLAAEIGDRWDRGEATALACSALKRRYRDVLSARCPELLFAYLDGSPELIAERLSHRSGHYMPASLLASQFEALEPPTSDENAIDLDLSQPMERLAQAIVEALASRRG